MQFNVNSKEVLDWMQEHNKNCPYADPMKQSTIGGRFTYSFTPTGLGCIKTIKCVCGEEFDLTHSEDW